MQKLFILASCLFISSLAMAQDNATATNGNVKVVKDNRLDVLVKKQIYIKNDKFKDFVKFIGDQKVGEADERIEIETIRIDGPMAMVWAPYQFYYKGKFHHCGVNSFQLVKLADGWKIQYLIDTRRKDCTK